MSQMMKTRQLLQDLGQTVDAAPLAMYFLTKRLAEKDIAEIQRLIPHHEFVTAWRAVEENGKELAKKLSGKDASTPSRAWRVLSSAKPEAVLLLDVTSRQQSVSEKIKNYFGKWRQMQQKLPLPEMAEMRITPQLPEYPKIAEEAFLLLLDGKLRNHSEIVKFLKPYEPPPPPPPPAPARRRGAKAAAVKAAVTGPEASAAAKRGRKPKEAVAPSARVEPVAAAVGEAAKKVAAKPAAPGEAAKKVVATPVAPGEAAKKVVAKPVASGDAAKKVAAKPVAPGEAAKNVVTKSAVKPAEKKAEKKAKPAPTQKAQPAKPVKKGATPKPAAKKSSLPAKPAAKKTPAPKKPAKAPAKKPAKGKK
jgi:hypothetical protein